MTRRADAYRAATERATSVPFAYGSNDSLLFVAHAVYSLIGTDYHSAFTPYSERQAMRLVRRAGGIVKFVSRFIGEPEPTLEGIRLCDPVVVLSDELEPFGGAGGLWNGRSAVVLGEWKGGGPARLVPIAPGAERIVSWRVG